MLEVKNLKKKFIKYNDKKEKQEFYADNGITFQAKEGQIIGILGPNGAGKTTLLRMIAGILEPSDGTICFDGLNYKQNEIEIKKKILDMKSFLYQKIENLSTGQMQRVNIARCLVHNPKYYILDEATSGLDIISSQIILDFIKKEKKNKKTILYSTHYMEEAENICDYVLMINEGIVIKEGTPDEIKKSTKTSNLRDSFFALIGGVNHEK